MILMTAKAAAKECCMTEREFLKAVEAGDLPDPVYIMGKAFWATHRIQQHLDGMVQSSWRDNFRQRLSA